MEVKCHSKYIPWIKRSILIVGIIPMLALTINDLVPLLKDYKDWEKNVLTQVSIEVNKSIPPPNITICILPYWSYSTALDTINAWVAATRRRYPNSTPPEAFTAMKNHSWDDVWDMNSTMLNEDIDDIIEDESVAKIVKRVVQLNEDEQDITLYGKGYGFHWNQPIIDAVWRYLVRVIELDRSLTPPYVSDEIDSTGIGKIPARVGQVSNKQMDKLFIRVLEAILPRYNFETDHTVPSTSVGIMDEGIGFCLQPYTTDTLDALDGSMIFSFLFRAHNTSGRVLRVFEDSSIMYSSPYYPYYLQLYGTHVAEAAADNNGRMTLTYSVESRFIENRTDPVCSNDLSSAMCFAKYQVNLTIEHCHCIPFAYRFLRDNPDHLPYCRSFHYESCHEKLLASANKNTDFCSRKCEYTFYRWNPTTVSQNSDDPMMTKYADDPTMIRLDLTVRPVQVTPYLEFKIVDKINLHELFSQLGGSIGFYLGFSCLSGFGVIGLLVEYIIKRYEARKGPTDPAENGANSMWTFLWTKNFLNILANRAEDDKRRKMEGTFKEMNELKKETGQLRELVDHERIENEKRDKIRCQKMEEMMDKKMDELDKKMDKKMDEMNKKMDKRMDEMDKKMNEMHNRMENSSKVFMQQLELMMNMLVQLKNDKETSKQ